MSDSQESKRKKSGRDRGIFEKVPGSGIWWIVWYHKGKRHREPVGTKEQARLLYGKRKADAVLEDKLPGYLERKKISFGELAEDAQAWAKVRHRSAKSDASRFKPLLEWWRHLPAEELTAQEIEKRLNTLKGKRGEAITGGTFNRYRSLISMIYRLGQKHERIRQGVNPARLVDIRPENKRVRWLKTDEERRLRAAISEHYLEHLPEIDLALNLGLRRGDQYGLSMDHSDGSRLSLTAGKNRQPLLLPVNGMAARAIQELAATNGERLHATKKPRHWFERACELAGIKDFHWHDLRHTFATRLLEGGVPAEKVQQLLGHKSITMTLRYAHLVGKYQGDALAKLEEINRNIRDGGGEVVTLKKAEGAS